MDGTCRKCGATNNLDAAFCQRCGAGMTEGADRPAQARLTDGDSPVITLVCAGIFLYFGFVVNMYCNTGTPVYNASVSAFTWGSRGVGIGLLAVAVLTFFRVALVYAVELVISFVAAAGCLVIGAIWVTNRDTDGYLLLLFGLLNAGAVKGSWSRLKAVRRAAGP